MKKKCKPDKHIPIEGGLTTCSRCGVGLYVRDNGSYSILTAIQRSKKKE